MIDTKELREKITIKGLDVVADTDILVVLDRLEAWENVFGHLGTPDEVGNEWHALSDRLEAAESEAIEQSRLNGMGAEREAALLAKLEAAEKERDALRAALQHEADCVEAAKAEIEALRAKIAAMEQQVPARLVTAVAYRWRYRGAVKWQYGELTEETVQVAKEHNHEIQSLGVLPGAHPAPSVPDGWKEGVEAAARLIDQKAERYANRFGIDDVGGLSFGEGPHAEIKMDHYTSMIELADEVRAMLAARARMSVPEGWKLVPIEPTPTMVKAGLESSHALNVHRVLVCYDAMIDAAPEAKP